MLLTLVVLGLPALTWKRVVDQLWIGLTGRQWVVVIATLCFPAGLTVLAVFGSWLVDRPAAREACLEAAPAIILVLLLLKLAAGVLVARAILRRRLVAPGTVGFFAAAWLVGAAVLFALVYRLTPPEPFSPFGAACAAVLLGLPLVRLALAPLALDWNRHR